VAGTQSSAGVRLSAKLESKPMSAEDNVQIVKSMYEAFGKGVLPALRTSLRKMWTGNSSALPRKVF